MRRSDGGGEPGRRLLVQEVRNDGVGWGFSNQEGGRAQSITLEGRAPRCASRWNAGKRERQESGCFLRVTGHLQRRACLGAVSLGKGKWEQ